MNYDKRLSRHTESSPLIMYFQSDIGGCIHQKTMSTVFPRDCFVFCLYWLKNRVFGQMEDWEVEHCVGEGMAKCSTKKNIFNIALKKSIFEVKLFKKFFF